VSGSFRNTSDGVNGILIGIQAYSSSVESITTLLQDQARTFGEFRRRDEMARSIRSTISFLYKLSATTALGDGIGSAAASERPRLYCFPHRHMSASPNTTDAIGQRARVAVPYPFSVSGPLGTFFIVLSF